MTEMSVSILIEAPPAVVFDAVSNVENLPNTNPEIQATEFLSEVRTGVGTRFSETRVSGKKKMVTELEITEYEPDHRVRFVNETHGTVWDTVFLVEPENEATRLSLVMDANAKNVLLKMLNRAIRGMVTKAVQRHIEGVKAYCESVV